MIVILFRTITVALDRMMTVALFEMTGILVGTMTLFEMMRATLLHDVPNDPK